MEYDNTNKGALWAKTSEKGLKYYQGSVNIEGVEYRISAFKNDKYTPESKLPVLNLKVNIEPKPEAPQNTAVKPAPFDDGLPF